MVRRVLTNEWFGTLVRLGLAAVWFFAALPKLKDPYSNVVAVRAYELLPHGFAKPVGYLQPMVEILLALCLLAGLLTRLSAVVSALLLMAFVFGIVWAWSRGLEIDCGCFGTGGPRAGASSQYPWEIARDAGFWLMSAFLVWRPTTKLALDNLLFRRTPERSLDVEAVS